MGMHCADDPGRRCQIARGLPTALRMGRTRGDTKGAAIHDPRHRAGWAMKMSDVGHPLEQPSVHAANWQRADRAPMKHQQALVMRRARTVSEQRLQPTA